MQWVTHSFQTARFTIIKCVKTVYEEQRITRTDHLTIQTGDKSMAWHLVRFLKANPEHTVVVLAGNGHAWKRGIPEQIRRRSSHAYRVILPEEPGRLQRGGVLADDLDYLWLKR